jgi:hypothetical protein
MTILAVRCKQYRCLARALPRSVENAWDGRTVRRLVWRRLATAHFFATEQTGFRAPRRTLDHRRAVEKAAISEIRKMDHASLIVDLLKWCRTRGMRFFDLSDELLALWITSFAERRGAKRTAYAVTAVRYFYLHRGLRDPFESKLVLLCLRALRHRREPPQREGVEVRHLRRMLATCDDSLAGRRDRALILMLACGAKCSKVRMLCWKDVVFCDAGCVIATAQWSLALSRGQYPETCPVRALERWRAVSGGSKYVFAAFISARGAHKIAERRGLSGRRIDTILRGRSTDAGISPLGATEFRMRFVVSLGQLGFNDVTFARLGDYKRTHSGRSYNATRTPKFHDDSFVKSRRRRTS